ncbi:MAG: cytochrome-c peroxidase, partial [Gammaproteobacteria bacterium]|nr:cytochrome-c peroxidase [Gammaproteobacteria bacterium]
MEFYFRELIKRICTGSVTVALFMIPTASFATDGHLPAPAIDSEFQQPSEEEIELGRMLFFDKELSGNRNISCATCHSPLIATVDGLSTNIGTGGQGLSVLRDAGNFPPTDFDPQARGARNMTPLFNLGHEQFVKLFWDGRIQVDPSIPQGFATPAGSDLPFGFDNQLAALSIFAETDTQEMLGEPGTNELADAALVHPQIGVWDGLVVRLGAIPEYVALFTAAFPEVNNDPSNITIVHVGTAIGSFQAAAFRSDNSPFDRYLRGDKKAMSKSAKRGAKLFYSKKTGCSFCHSGVFQTDHDFHAIGMPQIGPGFGDGPTGHEDFGREGFTGDPADRYRFRTPSLRNVGLTGPWGHDGAFNSLRAVVEHHLDAEESLINYDPSQIVMPPRPDLDALDLIALSDAAVTAAIINSIEIPKRKLSRE